MEENKSQSSYAIPVAIVIGFGLIAAAIFFSGNGASSGKTVTMPGADGVDMEQPSPENVNPVTENDHIKGNPNAQILLIEYSDFDCPFCKLFHDSMNQLMDEFGTGGRVAWVYRQFPIESLHPNAPMISQSSECVAKLGGNDAFWKFTDSLYESRKLITLEDGRQNIEPTDTTKIPELVEGAGVELDAFNTCMDSNETQADVEEDFNNAVDIGARGTPHTIIVVGDQVGVINGAQPYDDIKRNVQNLLDQLDGAGQ